MPGSAPTMVAGPILAGSLTLPLAGSVSAPLAGSHGQLPSVPGGHRTPLQGSSLKGPPGGSPQPLTRSPPAVTASPGPAYRSGFQGPPPGTAGTATAVWASPACACACQAPVAGGYPGHAALPTFVAVPRPTVDPMISHLQQLGAMNKSPEYQHLLNICMTQEKTKQELLVRLEASERELLRLRAENQELRSSARDPRAMFGMPGPGSTCSKYSNTMRSVPEGRDSPRSQALSRSKSGSMRLRRSLSSRPRFSDSLVVPFSLASESLQEKYSVEWQTCLHVGTMNCLQSANQMTISRFFKGKLKANSSGRVIKAVRTKQVPFFRLLEQHIGDQRNVDHPHICRLHDAFEDKQHVWQVFEFLSGPSLLEKILSDSQFSERDASAAIKAMIMAVSYLHGLSIAHQNVHLENMRFASQPRKKEHGSCYSDQLKLMDAGLSLNKKLIPSILNAASQPSAEAQPSLPLLGPLGFQNSLGFVCLPPECQGVCSSYAQLATAAPAMLQSSKSAEVLRRRGSSPSLPRGESQDLSQVSITSLGQDSAARRAQELLLLLQAGDVWCLGCAVHVLLCGQIPVVDPAKMGEQELPHLTATSPGATEFCRALLHPQPRKRPSAEAALECPWFGQCEGIQKAHRSQAKHTLGSLTAPKSAQFFEKLRQTASMTCLRRLFHSVRAVRGASVGKEGLQIPGPEEDNKDTSTNARAAADAMCAEAFEWLLFTSGATSSGGLPLRKLNTMIQSITQTERTGNVQRHEIEMLKVDTLISSVQFAEMIWATCA